MHRPHLTCSMFTCVCARVLHNNNRGVILSNTHLPKKKRPINQSINQFISRHSTEARATVRLCWIKEICLEMDLKCVNRWSSSTVQWKRVPKSRSSNRKTTSSSVQVVWRNWQKLCLCSHLFFRRIKKNTQKRYKMTATQHKRCKHQKRHMRDVNTLQNFQ